VRTKRVVFKDDDYKQVVRKLIENSGPYWLPFGGGGAASGLRRHRFLLQQ